MSRVAKAAIHIPNSVQVSLENNHVVVKGPKGELQQSFNRAVFIAKEQESPSIITFKPQDESTGWAQAGTARAIINNMVLGVTQGFEKTLELVGVGYRAQVSGHKLTLSLGFSHPIEYTLPAGITAEVPNNTTIVLKGIDKQLLGQIASEIRSYRLPEPYKGKGIKYAGETIIRKEAKKK